jgi:uncharacterized membrane protein
MSNKPKLLNPHIEGDEPTRLIALSDGLFATVLTILVLDLKLPELAQSASNGDLAQVAAQLWPHLFGYVLTFTVTGLFWLGHHRSFNYIRRYDGRLLWLNLSFLLFIGLVPFTTAALSSHGPTPLSWTLYASDMIGCGVTLALTCGYAVTHGLVDPDLPRILLHHMALRQLVMPAVFLLSIPIAYAKPNTYLAQFFILLGPVAEGILERRLPRRQPASLTVRQVWSERLWGLAARLPLLILLGLALWAVFALR